MNNSNERYIVSPMIFSSIAVFASYRKELKMKRCKDLTLKYRQIKDRNADKGNFLQCNAKQNDRTSIDGESITLQQTYVTYDELCKIIGKSRRTLQRQIKNKQFPDPIKVSGRSVWPEEVILKLKQGYNC